MKNALLIIVGSVVLAAASGCAVVPARVAVAEPSAVYIGPTYESPGVGYVWEYHARYGWGWHHPVYGWHRGWR